ncbi:aquaporin NIP2-1-like isoform X2 [Cornus florida]|uniref:aquaporin NIP2-1-like isoform X2 n=1 Tax=Cornus florida TaxID=4283 RepID=UPI0028A2D1B2|nr:aquaporin NIP2-1-like isoform X2 [Cornus florida]
MLKGSLERLKTMNDGMNGYIALCVGDPCPLIFRSPVTGLEDIMDNQVIFPDAHKHIARPPAGVIFPNKVLGTYFLIFAGCATVVVNLEKDKVVTLPGITIVWGLAVMVLFQECYYMESHLTQILMI